MSVRIAALRHARERRASDIGYKLWHIAEQWVERGIELVPVRGLKRVPSEVDLWLNHLDLTHVPQAYAAFLAAQEHVANGRLLDVSKRAVSTNLVAPGDGYDGPVVIKTDLNHGGRPERRAFRRGHADDPRAAPKGARIARPDLPEGALGDLMYAFAQKGRLGSDAYLHVPAASDVPQAVHDEPGLVVERLLEERDGPHWCGRCALFLGDRGLALRKWGTAPVLRAGTVVRMEEIELTPDVERLRARFGLDYGKIDYVVIDGRPVVFDVSRTPTFALADAPLTPFDRHMVEVLAPGIDALLAGFRA